MPSADLAGEVVLFSLSLTAAVGTAPVAKQLYTFGVLRAGASIHANMTSIRQSTGTPRRNVISGHPRHNVISETL